MKNRHRRLKGGRLLSVAGLLTASLGTLSPHPVSASGWGLAELMQGLAQNPGGRARFVEKKYLALLDKPIESSGLLTYQAPNHFEKRTLAPQPEDLILDGDVLTLLRAKKKYVLPLGRFPEAAALLTGIRATLLGDRPALERRFHLAMKGQAEHWTLTLSPLDAHLTPVLQRILVQGIGRDIRSIEIWQTDGDHSVMVVAPIDGS